MIKPLDWQKFNFKMLFRWNICFWTRNLLLSFHMGTAIVLRQHVHREPHGLIRTQCSLLHQI